MCTMITAKYSFEGHAKGPKGWFPIEQVYLGYDHPAHSPSEHAILIDLANEDLGTEFRLAVELSRDAAAELAALLLQTLEKAERYEAKSA